jgi:glycosyltransferase involved in cell wall biosynthesis
VTDRVRLLGRVSGEELAAWYGAADLFLTLSREEAFGMTVLEAAAAGAPVLASDIPAHREVRGYADPERIVLVPLEAGAAALTEAVRSALALGRSTDRTGWRLPTWSGMVDGVEAVYDVVLQGRARSH